MDNFEIFVHDVISCHSLKASSKSDEVLRDVISRGRKPSKVRPLADAMQTIPPYITPYLFMDKVSNHVSLC